MRISLALAFCSLPFAAQAVSLPICGTKAGTAEMPSCLYDGDTGVERGTRWQLMGVDAPEIDGRDARCRKEQEMGLRARDRLRTLMARGYTIVYQAKTDSRGRELAKITLADGRDVASELMSEGLVQALPHTRRDRWCGR